MLDDAEVLWVFSHNVVPSLSSDCVADDIGVSTINEEKSFLEDSLVRTNQRRMPKLLPIFSLFVDFVSNIILSRKYEEYLLAILKFMSQHLAFAVETHLQILHY